MKENTRPGRPISVAILILAGIVVVFAVVRVVVDIANARAGLPLDDGDFHRRYLEHPWTAYAHIAPGLVYLLGAPLQLSRRFRERHITFHRRLGRAVLVCGMVAGVFALALGLLYPFGGAVEASATVTFGTYFLVVLTGALVAIRRRQVATHRRWMIRAFAVALGVATQRIWLGLLTLLTPWSFEANFGAAFWLAWVPHALAAEVYLSWTDRRVSSGVSAAGPGAATQGPVAMP